MVLAIALLIAGTELNAQAFSSMSGERLWRLGRVSNPIPSPDGQWVVFSATEYSTEDQALDIDLWLAPAHGKQIPTRLTRNTGADVDAAWSPDSKRILYISKRHNRPAQVYIMGIFPGGEPTPLTDWPADVNNPQWLGTSGKIVFEAPTYPDLGADRDAVAERISERSQQQKLYHTSNNRLLRSGRQWISDSQVTHLIELDINTLARRDLTPDIMHPMLPSEFSWDINDKGSLIAYSNLSSLPPFNTRTTDLWMLNLRSGQRTNLTADNPGNDFSPLFLPERNDLIYGRRHQPDSLSEFTELVHRAWPDPEVRVLNDARQLSPLSWTVVGDSSHVYFTAQERARKHLYRVGLTRGTPHVVIKGGDIGAPKISKKNLFFINQSLFQPPTITVSDLNGRHQKQLSFDRYELMSRTRVGSFKELRDPNHPDLVHGLMVYPPGFRPSQKWPVVIALHGGPHQAWSDRFDLNWNLATLSAPGYIVVAPNPVGSTGYGQDYARAIEGNPVNRPAQQILQLTDYLESLPYVDTRRIAVGGFSYGGYLANWLNTQTNRYKTVISHAGIFDLMAQYASDHPWGRDLTYGAFPWSDPQRLRTWSPSSYTDGIKSPTLFLHGEQDTRVPPSQSILGHNLLTGQNIESRLVLLRTEAHGMSDPKAALEWWRQVHLWLAQQLGSG